MLIGNLLIEPGAIIDIDVYFGMIVKQTQLELTLTFESEQQAFCFYAPFITPTNNSLGIVIQLMIIQ